MSEEVLNPPALTAEAVAKYLSENPTFFLQQEQLLTDMFLPHESGEAVSLLERQVSLLRERNIDMRKRLSEILEQGQRNDVLFTKTRSLVLQLLEAQNLNDLSRRLKTYCEQEFQVDNVQFIVIANTQTHSVSEALVLAENEVRLAMPMLLNGTDAISGNFRDEEFKFLFAGSNNEVAISDLKSAVVMPVTFNRSAKAFIVLGANDADYFQTGMDTLFLGFIADVLARQLPKYI